MGKLKLTTDAKKVFQILLRTAFAFGYMPEYKYDEDPNVSLIDIRRDFPLRFEKFPTIIVQCVAGDSSIDELGPTNPRHQKVNETTSVPEEIEYRGSSTLTISMAIYAGSRNDRDKLTDFVAFCVRFLFRDKATEEGFEYTKVRLGGDAQEIIDNEPRFTHVISVDTISEFEENIPVELLDVIQRIEFASILAEDGEYKYEVEIDTE